MKDTTTTVFESPPGWVDDQKIPSIEVETFGKAVESMAGDEVAE
jgi:hypothetical protein